MKQLTKKYCSPVDTKLNLGRKIFQDKNQNRIEKVEIPQIISEIIWRATFVNQLITKRQNAQIKIVVMIHIIYTLYQSNLNSDNCSY